MTTRGARIALLERLIDHAPLFPPASLPLSEALEEDRLAQESPHAFMLGRFVCPASRLEELPDVGRGLSAVLEGGNAVLDGVEAVECRWTGDHDGLSDLAPEVYVELAPDDALERRLDRLAAEGLRAKVRCGGDEVPSVAELARFVRACRERGVVFKATAGLHHAVATDGEHGLVNLLAAVVFGDEEAALAERDPTAFALRESGFRWRDREAASAEVARARREVLHSIGSCSFSEPVEELEALGALPA